MNLFFRLILISILVRFKSRISVLGPCRTPFRCWPTDLDVLRHMNNGIYFSLMDLARVDLMGRAGLLSKLKQKNWYPVVVAETMRFRRSIQPFDKFEIESSVIGWDEKAFLVRQRFIRKNEDVAAEAIVRARFLKKSGGSVSPKEILELAGVHQESMALEDWVAGWNAKQV